MERTILCFGDSNTHGTRAMRRIEDRRRFKKAERWPGAMAAALDDGWDVIAEGHPGRNTVFDDPIGGAHKNGLTVLPSLLESHRPIDLVIVMLGTNDLQARFSVPASDIVIGIERLVTLIKQSDAGPEKTATKVLIVSPVPVEEVGFLAEMFVGGAAKSRALPRYIQEMAVRQGTGFLDLAPVASVDMVDGIHLSAEGQAAIGVAMAGAVRDVLG